MSTYVPIKPHKLYRINSEEPEDAGKRKGGVASRCHPLEDTELPKDPKFSPWVAIVQNIIP